MSPQSLPPELIERIVVLLPLPDISSLRLTSKCLASKTAQKHLKAKLRTKRVNLTEQRLRAFVDVTAYDGLGCLIQDLTLIAPVYNIFDMTARLRENSTRVAKLDEAGAFTGLEYRGLTEEQARQTKLDLHALQERRADQLDLHLHRRDVSLLAEAFSNLASHNATLRMLRVEVEVYKDDTTTPLLPLFGGHREPIWAAAAHVSRTLFASLADCDLPVQSLDLFNSSRMLRCSLSCNELNNVDFASGTLGSSLGHVTELSLSISAEVTQETNSDGLRAFLRTCPSIRRLDLVHFLMDYVEESRAQDGRILRALGESSLPRLCDLTLQGFKVTEKALDGIAARPRQGTKSLATVRSIELTDGKFKRVLDYCTVQAALEEVKLDSLLERRIHQFEPPWVVGPDFVPGTPPLGYYPGTRAC